MDLASLVDTVRYPVDRPGSDGFAAAVAEARRGLDHDGCTVLRNFVRPDALAGMVEESARLRARAHAVNRNWYPYPPYESEGGGNWPQDHPRRFSQKRQNRFVAYDLLGRDSPLRNLYESPAMASFVRAVVGVDDLHPYGDPLGACALSIQEPGEQLPWHFDVTHFVVSLLIVEARSGGRFNYAPRLRSGDCENYPAVASLLRGNHPFVDLDLKPGDLQLFEGRHSMHRVTAPESGTWRCMALLSYCERPGVIGSEAMQRNLFGRTDRALKHWTADRRED